MPQDWQKLLPIDTSLRFFFVGLECALGVSLRPLECERVFADAKSDQVSAKEYVLLERRDCVVTGSVEDYEPEDILIRLSGNRQSIATLDFVAESSAAAWVRMSRFDESASD